MSLIFLSGPMMNTLRTVALSAAERFDALPDAFGDAGAALEDLASIVER